MVRRTDKTDFQRAFGEALNAELAKSQMQQKELARATNASPSYINKLANGSKRASPEWANIIADAMKLDRPARVKLHEAAARDWGFDLDLTKKD